MDKKVNISYLIDSLFPDHVAANYPRLIEFAKIFFEYLEENNRSSYYQNTLYLQRDVREQDPEFAEYIKRELGILSRRDYAVDPKIFYDNIVEIWQSKGSEESIKTFFRLFFNDEVEIYYPWEAVLIPSDGRWVVDTVIRVTRLVGEPEEFAGKRIFQVASDAEAVVDRVERKVYADQVIYELKLIPRSVVGTFIDHKVIYADETLTAEVYRSVVALNIQQAGSGYKVGDKITLDGYEGMSFVAYVDSVDQNGGILGASINDFGSGNTPFSVIATNTTKPYFLIDFVFYEYELDENYGLITQTGVEPFVNYGLITENVVLASDYGYLTLQEVQDLNIIIFTEEGSDASVEIKYGALATYNGYYDGIKGQLSEGIVLQDSKYYQKFSYEVQTSFSSSQWLQPLKKFAHPAGTEVIGNVIIFNKYNVGIQDYFIFVKSQDPVEFTFIESPGISDTALGFVQDYVLADDFYFAEDYVGVTAFDKTSIIPEAATQQTIDTTIEQEDFESPLIEIVYQDLETLSGVEDLKTGSGVEDLMLQ
jgi:hypothetical protein